MPRQAVREAQREREREREILRERGSDAGQGSRGSRQEREREKRGRSGNDARARRVHNARAPFHFSRSGLAWLIIVHWPGLDAVANWALVTRVVP